MMIIIWADLVLVVVDVVMEQVMVVVRHTFTLVLGVSRSHQKEDWSECK